MTRARDAIVDRFLISSLERKIIPIHSLHTGGNDYSREMDLFMYWAGHKVPMFTTIANGKLQQWAAAVGKCGVKTGKISENCIVCFATTCVNLAGS